MRVNSIVELNPDKRVCRAVGNTKTLKTLKLPRVSKIRKRLLNFWKLFWNQNDSPLPSGSAQISVEFPPHLLVCSPAVCPQSLAAAQRRSIAAFQELLKTACSSAASRCSRSSKDWSADENKPHTTAADETLTQFNRSSHQLLKANRSSYSKKVCRNLKLMWCFSCLDILSLV